VLHTKAIISVQGISRKMMLCNNLFRRTGAAIEREHVILVNANSIIKAIDVLHIRRYFNLNKVFEPDSIIVTIGLTRVKLGKYHISHFSGLSFHDAIHFSRVFSTTYSPFLLILSQETVTNAIKNKVNIGYFIFRSMTPNGTRPPTAVASSCGAARSLA
jgi:hypothetical protein